VKMLKKILIIDNYDSFTYNLVQGFLSLGAKVDTHRNDKISIAEAIETNPTHLVISPGPGSPKDAGISNEFIGYYSGKIPVLGVCLGHQCIIEHFGGDIINAKALVHGKSSRVIHDKQGVFKSINSPMEAGRYHSLAGSEKNMPSVLKITATTNDKEIMGVRHKDHLTEGVQFHPESVLTPDGLKLMQNFIEQSYGN
jgi:anthranilate synthase/aminodeoxychorismate synthase-like glutamine amidotransferase